MLSTFKSISLLGATGLTGLSAGLFYAWSVSVIPGTLKISDTNYLTTMQAINKAILNPGFFIVFFGSLVFLILACINAFQHDQTLFTLLLTATAMYLIGTLGVTAFGNVPLNNQLEALHLHEMSLADMASFRKFYELKWNRLHLIRTLFAVASFVLTIWSLYSQISKPS